MDDDAGPDVLRQPTGNQLQLSRSVRRYRRRPQGPHHGEDQQDNPPHPSPPAVVVPFHVHHVITRKPSRLPRRSTPSAAETAAEKSVDGTDSADGWPPT